MAGPMYRVPYGKSQLDFTLPAAMHADLAVSRPTQPLSDVANAICESLAHPIGSSPLRELAAPGSRVCIVFTDITRSSPDHLLVPALLGELEKAGVRDEDITLLCGIGMHRASTASEKIAKLGADVVGRYA